MSVTIAGKYRYPILIRTLLMILVIAGLAGCGTLQNQLAPKQSFNTDKDIKQLEEEFGKASSIKSYYAGPRGLKERNKFITGRLVLINIHYIQFIRQFAANKAQLDTATDMLQLGVDLAITVVGGAAVKAALGAVSAGITGTRISINKNFFYEKTVPVLITAMNAQRKEALIPIIAGIRKDTDKYPLAQAVTDLETYYFAGTFVGALQAIQKNSAEKEVEADKAIAKLAITRGKEFLGKNSVSRKAAIIAKLKTLNPNEAIALSKNPPTQEPFSEQIVARQDPRNLRFTNGRIALITLITRAENDKRTDDNLSKWEVALGLK